MMDFMFMQGQRSTKAKLYIGLVVVGILFSPALRASSIIYDYDEVLSGVPPTGAAPWLTAVFSDNGPSTVQLTLTAPGLLGHEFVSQWFFNLIPALDPAKLIFTETASSGSLSLPTITAGAASDATYNILLNFGYSGAGRTGFSGGDSLTYTITGIAGLMAEDFLYGHTPIAGHEPFYTAAYVETTGEAVILDRVHVVQAARVPDDGHT